MYIIDWSIKKASFSNKKDVAGETALHTAARAANESAILMMLNAIPSLDGILVFLTFCLNI